MNGVPCSPTTTFFNTIKAKEQIGVDCTKVLGLLKK